MSSNKASPARKSLNDIKVKHSPVKKQNNKYNNVFVKGYKFGLRNSQTLMRMLISKISLIYLILTPKLVMILASLRLLLLGIQASAVLPKFKVLDTRLAIS